MSAFCSTANASSFPSCAIARMASRCTCGSRSSSIVARSASASWPPNIRSMSMAVRRTVGFGDCFSRSTVSRPAAPKPNKQLAEARIALLFSSTIEHFRQRTDHAPRRSSGRCGRRDRRRHRRPCAVGWRSGARARHSPVASTADSATDRSASRPPVPVRGRWRTPACARRRMSPAFSALFDLANDDPRGIAPGRRVVFHSAADRAAGAKSSALMRVRSTVASHACDALGRVVRHALDVDGLLLRAGELAARTRSDTKFSSEYDASMLAADSQSSSKPACWPSGLCSASCFARSIRRSLRSMSGTSSCSACASRSEAPVSLATLPATNDAMVSSPMRSTMAAATSDCWPRGARACSMICDEHVGRQSRRGVGDGLQHPFLAAFTRALDGAVEHLLDQLKQRRRAGADRGVAAGRRRFAAARSARRTAPSRRACRAAPPARARQAPRRPAGRS